MDLNEAAMQAFEDELEKIAFLGSVGGFLGRLGQAGAKGYSHAVGKGLKGTWQAAKGGWGQVGQKGLMGQVTKGRPGLGAAMVGVPASFGAGYVAG